MRGTPALFLDRDGVVIQEVNYLADVGQVRLIPGTAEAVARANRLGIPVVIVTNQAGVARGLFPEERVHEVHDHLLSLLSPWEARIDRFYHCPHHPTAGLGIYRTACECRKPRPGLLVRAAADLGLDLGHSCLVGDKVSDLEAGAAVGCGTVLVRTGHGNEVHVRELDDKRLNLLGVVPDLAAALDLCLAARFLPSPRPAEGEGA
jgi:D-glycero-D-manno-heptose 1,7-bisphosphate phosphatase